MTSGKIVHDSFVNENDRRVSMAVWCTESGVIVSAATLASSLDHTWTRMEAERLHRLLGEALYESEGEECPMCRQVS